MKKKAFFVSAILLFLLIPAATASAGIPVAAAGLTRYAATDPVVLDGTDSYDPNGSSLSYSWQQVSGPIVTITDTNSPTPTVGGFIQTDSIQVCLFELVVNNGQFDSPPDTVEVKIVPDFSIVVRETRKLILQSDSFDPQKPTVVYFPGGDCFIGRGGRYWGGENKIAWQEKANVIRFAYEPPFERCGDMLIVYLSKMAPNYNQPIQIMGFSTGAMLAIDNAKYLNLTFADRRYAVNRVTFLDAGCNFMRDYHDDIIDYLASSVDGEQCWADNYISAGAHYQPNTLNVAFETFNHHLAPYWYGNSIDESIMNQFNGGVIAGAYWSVAGPGKNLQLAPPPQTEEYFFYWTGDEYDGYVSFYNESQYPGRLPEPVTLLNPVSGGTTAPGGVIFTCEESQNAIAYQLLFGTDPYRVMDYNIISDTNGPLTPIITTLPFEKTFWTIKARDQYGSTIYADPLCIDAFVLTMPVENLNTGLKYGYIQSAIDEAGPGDEIVADPGTYYENIDFMGKNLIVRSTDPNDPAVVAATVICADPLYTANDGPAVSFSGGEDANSVLAGFTITSSSTIDYGSGIYCFASSPTITNCIITGNSATHYGAGMYNYYCSPTLTNCTFTGNSAASEGTSGTGGAIYNRISSPILTGCTFNTNTANRGGAIYNDDSTPVLINCSFNENSADQTGGAIHNCSFSNTTLTNCTFTGNSTDGYGGAIHSDWYSSLTLTSSLFAANSALHGGAIFSYHKNNLNLFNCTFAGNSAANGTAVACDSLYSWSASTNLNATNCIFWNGIGGIWNNNDSVINITYSDVQGGWSGAGGNNINTDPCFDNPDANDYHLLPASPCINTGDSDYIPGPNETDLDGLPRVIDGRIDMGAYEFNHIPIADAGPNQIIYLCFEETAQVTLDGTGSYDQDGHELTYIWKVDGRIIGSDGIINMLDYAAITVQLLDSENISSYLTVLEPLFEAWLSTPALPNWDSNVDVAPTTPTGAIVTIQLPAGEHIVELVVNDGFDDSEPNYAVVTIVPPVQADVRFTPQRLNCKSSGNWVKAHFTLPEGFVPEDVDTNTPATAVIIGPVTTVQVESEYITVYVNNDGTVGIEIGFDRQVFCGIIPDNGFIHIEVTGYLKTSRCFHGQDSFTTTNH